MGIEKDSGLVCGVVHVSESVHVQKRGGKDG